MNWLRLSSVGVAWVGSAWLLAGALSAGEPKVLTIGIDGLRRDAFVAAKTPHLDSLAENGTLCLETRVTSDDVTDSDTVSGPGWTTFLTGVWADRHGVLDNSFKGRDAQAAPHGFALAKQVKPNLRTASYLCWTPLRSHVTTDADIDVVVTPGKNATASTVWTAADQSLAWSAIPVLQNDDADWTFIYFGSTDETGHSYGFHPSVPPYMAAIENVDRMVGELLEAVKQRETYAAEDWLILVSTDHGGEGTGHGGGRENPNVYTVPMIVSGASAKKGAEVERPVGSALPATVDLVALALTHLQIPIQPEWQLAGSVDGWLEPASTASEADSKP
ncbi:alkaline phosphatase family protein [Rhodopirellula sp. P2]|uniref:alkaline phosphatase family protein n=1 Tax=Rhodopirellula sp. P2 TaxID=2127060 RepID=UPI0023685133|nr:alkaline phosphatase family protein [Rhodopirellula sp. P2]WDQ18116.1 alkaline phosphatase family protein [Rhodopirellula sp. P2]